MVEFYVVLKTDLLPVINSDDAQVHDIFVYLKSESHVARGILGRTLFDQYDYYKLENPVPIPRCNSNTTTIVHWACLDRNNWQAVPWYRSVKALAPTLLNSHHVYMIIQPREGETEKAIADLNTNYVDIFSCLQIKVSHRHRWTMEDVSNNLEGGRLWRFDDVRRPVAISAIEELLSRRLPYNVSPSAPIFGGLRQSFSFGHAFTSS